MATLNSGKIIRKVRNRLELSQEGLSRLMNATKAAVQHWERGRNVPGFGRLLALRQLCPRSPERKELDALIQMAQNGTRLVPLRPRSAVAGNRESVRRANGTGIQRPNGLARLQRENGRLQRQLAKFESALKSRDERLRILENLAADLQREMAQIRAKQ